MIALVPTFVASLIATSSTSQLLFTPPNQRIALPVVVVNPTGEPGPVSSSQILDIVGRLLARRTDFYIFEVPPSNIDSCGTNVSCYFEYLDRRDLHRRRADFFLVVTNLSDPTGNALSARLLHRTENEQVSVFASPSLDVQNTTQAEHGLARIFVDSFGSVLSSTGHLEPFAEIAILGQVLNSIAIFDGNVLGAITSSVALIQGIRPGTHRIEIQKEDHEPYVTTLSFSRNEKKRLEVTMRSKLDSTTERVALLASLGLLVAGGAAIVGGLLVNQPTACISTEQDDALCSRARFASLGMGRHPSGLMPVPLGISLFTAGAGLGLSTILISPDSDDALLLLGASAVLSVGIYVLFATIQPESIERP